MTDNAFEEWFWANNREQTALAAESEKETQKNDKAFGLHNFEETGRGIIARQNLEEGEVILRVPPTMMISMTNPELRRILETQLADPSILQDSFASIVLLLLYERSKPISFWQPYFDALPTPSIPMLWEDHLFDDMKHSCPVTYTRLKKQKRVFNEAYFKVFYPVMKSNPHLFDLSRVTLQVFRWAVWVVLSRAFELEDVPAFAVIPMADMFNHQCNYEGGDDNTIKFHTAEEWFVITVATAVTQGSQCYFSYGKSQNEDFFLCYGFLLPFNRYHCMPWTLSDQFYAHVSHLSMKQDVLKTNNIPITSEYLLDLGDQSMQFLYALTIYMMDKTDFDELDRTSLSRDRLFLSDAHRERVVQYLKEMVAALASRHSLTVEEYEDKMHRAREYPERLVLDYQRQELIFVHRLREYVGSVVGSSALEREQELKVSRGGA